jgi:hypothetical protein
MTMSRFNVCICGEMLVPEAQLLASNSCISPADVSRGP